MLQSLSGITAGSTASYVPFNIGLGSESVSSSSSSSSSLSCLHSSSLTRLEAESGVGGEVDSLLGVDTGGKTVCGWGVDTGVDTVGRGEGVER